MMRVIFAMVVLLLAGCGVAQDVALRADGAPPDAGVLDCPCAPEGGVFNDFGFFFDGPRDQFTLDAPTADAPPPFDAGSPDVPFDFLSADLPTSDI